MSTTNSKHKNIFFVFDGMIGNGKSTAIKYIKQGVDEIKELVNSKIEGKIKLNFYFKDERAAISPFLAELYDVFAKQTTEEIYNDEASQSILRKIEHSFISSMGEDIKRFIDIAKEPMEDEEVTNVNVFVLDRALQSVELFIRYYNEYKVLTPESFNHLNNVIKDYKDEYDFLISNNIENKAFRAIRNKLISTTEEQGYSNVVKRSRNGEVMSKEYYNELYTFYQNNRERIFGDNSKNVVITNNGTHNELRDKIIMEVFNDIRDIIKV